MRKFINLVLESLYNSPLERRMKRVKGSIAVNLLDRLLKGLGQPD